MSDPNEVPDLYRLAFIPGVFRCPKCDFELCKQTLSVATGNVGTTEENRQSEPCPNDGTWMVAVTYRERVAQYHDLFEETLTALELAVKDNGAATDEDVRIACNTYRDTARTRRKI